MCTRAALCTRLRLLDARADRGRGTSALAVGCLSDAGIPFSLPVGAAHDDEFNDNDDVRLGLL